MAKSPVEPLIEDDSTYLTVVHPYPPNTNLHLPTDWRALALWLACCTGTQDVLRAMYHKPKAASMVVIEVDREFERIDALLGMHSWSEFLLAPTKEEAGKSSKVFYCTYNNGKAVKNAGWNRVDVQDHWFKGWRLDNDRIKHPYPKTTYCDVPPEAKTGVSMCSHLPRGLFSVILPQQELPAHQVGDRTEDNAPSKPSTAMAMMNLFGIAPNPAFVMSSGTPRGTEEGPSTPETVPIRDQSRADGKAPVEDNPWDGYDAFRPDPPTRVKKRGKEKWICPQHGPMCNPGICKARGKVDRDDRWRKEREEREEAKRKGRRRGRRERGEGEGSRRGLRVPRSPAATSQRVSRMARGEEQAAAAVARPREMAGTIEVRCAPVREAPTLLLTCQPALARNRRRRVRGPLFRQKEGVFLYPLTTRKTRSSQSRPPLPGPAASAPMGRPVAMAMAMRSGGRTSGEGTKARARVRKKSCAELRWIGMLLRRRVSR